MSTECSLRSDTIDGDRQVAVGVQLAGRLHAHCREHAERHQVLPRRVERGGLNCSPWWISRRRRTKSSCIASRPLMWIGPRSARGPVPASKTTSIGVVGGAQGDGRQVDLGHRVAVIADCVQQAIARRQNIGGDGRSAGGEAELVAGVGRHRALDADLAEMELGAGVEARCDLGLRFGRQLARRCPAGSDPRSDGPRSSDRPSPHSSR